MDCIKFLHEMSTMCLHLVCKHDAECTRLLLSEGHRLTASLVHARGQLTPKLLHVVAGTHLTRVQVKSFLGKSTEDLLSYLRDLKAVRLALGEKTRETWEEAYIDAECVTALVMSLVVVEGISTQRSVYNSIVDAALSIEDALCQDHSESGKALLYMVLLLSPLSMASLRDHNSVWRSLCPLLKAAKDFSAVKNSSWKLFLCFMASTKVQNLRNHVPTRMEAFQDMCFNLNFASNALCDNRSSLQKLQVMNKETGDRLLDDEFDDFSKSYARYTGFKTSVFRYPQVAKIKRQCVLKQDSKYVPQKQGYMSNIFVWSFTSGECGYLTACSAAEHGCKEKSVVTVFKRENVLKPLGSGFLEFEIEEEAVNTKDNILGKAVDVKDVVVRTSLLLQPKCIPFPEPLSFLIELPESTPDHQCPIYSPTASITGGFCNLTESQQAYACSQSNVQSQHGNNWCSRSNIERVPIFVRQISGKVVVLIVDLDEPSEHMMCLYEEKTKMKFAYEYFRYGGKTIDPDHTLLFYGVGRNSTIDACGRLLGGMPTTLARYVHDNRNKFLKEVALPNGQISLKITKKGCRFLNTWLKCFTTAFSMGKSWNGAFTLDDFKHVDGHILIIKMPRKHEQGLMQNDLAQFVLHVEQILHSDNTDKELISKYPPYLKNFTHFLSHMAIYDVLPAQDKLYVETHVCCTTSCERETLVIKLYRRYEGLDSNEKIIWDDAIQRASCPVPWSTNLSGIAVFKEMIEQAIKDHRPYSETRFGAFTFVKDIAMHGTDERKGKRIQNVNGIELMVPAYLEDFVPSIIKNLIERNVDISAELLAAKIKCFCKICESANSSDSD